MAVEGRGKNGFSTVIHVTDKHSTLNVSLVVWLREVDGERVPFKFTAKK